MKHTIRLLVTVCLVVPVAGASAADGVSFDAGADQLQIEVDGQPFATYVFRDPKIPRPYLAHVRAPGGAQVTRNHPPVEGVDATDHATFHPGIWLAFGDLSTADFWRNKAVVKHAAFVERPRVEDGVGRFAVKNEYLADDKLLCQEICRITILPRPAGYLILWDSTFTGPDDFYFGDQEEMGLGVRMATPLAVDNGGRITNSDGGVDEEQVWGQQADWCDYSGKIDGRALGILIVPDRRNFRRSWYHARDYGFVAANPFGRNAFTNGEKSKLSVPRGESLRLRYAVLVHAGPVDLESAAAAARKALESAD